MISDDERTLLLLEPVFQNKIWGGRNLESYGYTLPEGPVGEAWAISAHPHGDCKIKKGPYSNCTLSELCRSHPELFGNLDCSEFPLLVKIIDAKDDLSIQVHPDNFYAYSHEEGSLGKRECWYVLNAGPEASIVVGQKAKSREEFAQKVSEGQWDELLNEIPIQKGDFFQIDPGCVHAIKAGTMILETQQSSDITYRVYDYDRVQQDGTLRDLHLDKSLDVIDYSASCPQGPSHPELISNSKVNLVKTPDYTVDIIAVDGSYSLPISNAFTCISIIDGEGIIQGIKVCRGDHGIITHDAHRLEIEGQITVLLSHP